MERKIIHDHPLCSFGPRARCAMSSTVCVGKVIINDHYHDHYSSYNIIITNIHHEEEQQPSLNMIIRFILIMNVGQVQAVPCYKITTILDFLKSAPGSVDQPVTLDDSDLHTLTPAQVKSLFDITVRRTLVKVRYTATKFMVGQVRLGCDNLYNEVAANDLTVGQIDLLIIRSC
eukprot:2425426-Amphidinium_carterae.3